MPIDPRIPLSALGGSPQQLDVAGTIYRSQAAHAMQAEAQRKQQEALKQQQIDALAQQYPDPEDYLRAVSQIDPFYAAKVGEQFEKVKKEQLEGHIKKLDLDDKKLGYYIRTAQAAGEDPDQYAIWRQDMVQRDPSMEPMLPRPEQWADPNVRRQFFMMGDTLANSVKLERDTADKFIKGDYRKGLLDAVAGAPTIDVARGILDAAKGFAPKGDLAYVNALIASAPDFETARQQASAASGSKQYQHVTIDEGGTPVIGAFDPDTGDVLSTGAAAPTRTPGAGSDYSQFLDTFAKERGKTVDQLTVAENVAARKAFGQADDRPITVNTQQRPLTETAEAAIVQRLQTQWTKATTSHTMIGRQVAIMEQGLQAGRRGDLPQANEAVLQTFLKILDPDSVVREGEFQRLREGASLLTRAETAFQRLTEGGFLPMAELEKYAQLAKEIQTATQGSIDPIKSRIGKTADRYRIPRDLVMDEDAAPAAPAAPAATTPAGVPKKIGRFTVREK